MSGANFFMLGLGIFAFVVGAALLIRQGGSERAVYVRRIVGAMLGALGLVLMIFAIGLAGVGGSADA